MSHEQRRDGPRGSAPSWRAAAGAASWSSPVPRPPRTRINQFILTHPQSAVAKALNRPANIRGNYAYKPTGPRYDQGYVAIQTAHGGLRSSSPRPTAAGSASASPTPTTIVHGPALHRDRQQHGQRGPGQRTPSDLHLPDLGRPSPREPSGLRHARRQGRPDRRRLDRPAGSRSIRSHSPAQGLRPQLRLRRGGPFRGAQHRLDQHHQRFDPGDPRLPRRQSLRPAVDRRHGTVDRIAFSDLLPARAIGVGGTLNTLDILNNVDLTSGPGITIGRDLNLFNAGGDVTLANGASLRVGRFAGLQPQPPKGTSTGANILSLNQSLVGTGTSQVVPSVSGYIQGNFTIGPGSVFSVAQRDRQ